MNNSVKHVRLLDHLRGIAIIAVLLSHTLGHIYGFDTLPWRGWLRNTSLPASLLCFFPFSIASQAGVAIFFVVSGFCIHMSFQRQGQQWGSFFTRRFFRIYPPYLAALIFSFLVNLSESRMNPQSPEAWTQLWNLLIPKQLLTHLFLVHNFYPSTLYGFTGSFWSLAVEAQLYLLYPVFLFLTSKLGWRRTMITLAGGELLIRGLDGVIQTLNATNTVGGHISWFLTYSPLGYWFSWAVGAFIADAFLKNQPLPLIKTAPVMWLSLALISYFVKPLYAFQFLFFAMMTAGVTSRLLSGARPEITVPTFALAVLQKIGLWSYSIYLLHQPLIQIYSTAMCWAVPSEYRPAPITFLLILVTWLAVIPFSVLWYKLIELPGIALGKRIIQKSDIRKGARADQQLLQRHLVVNNQTGRVRKSNYVLMICTLLVVAVGSLFINAKLTPPTPMEKINLAWSLATSPDAAKRNGALAVKLAEDACQRTQYREPVMVGTLAAAYAEAGRFKDAISTMQKASTLASQLGDQKLLKKCQEMLALFLKHQPYHQAASSEPGK